MSDRIATLLFASMLLVGGALCAALCFVGCARAYPPGGDDSDEAQADAQPDYLSPDARPGSSDATVFPDGEPVCPTSPCDLVEQCGCTPPQVCDLDTGNIGSTQCRAVSVPGTEESACGTLTECDRGYVCVSDGCSKFCKVDADCGDPRRKCAVTLYTGGMPVPNATTCSSACEPPNAAAGDCPPGRACRMAYTDVDADPDNGNETVYAMCGAAGAGVQGDTCTRSSDCAANFLCLNNDGLECARICTLSPAGGECTTGTCRGLIPSMLIGGVVYGVCL